MPPSDPLMHESSLAAPFVLIIGDVDPGCISLGGINLAMDPSHLPQP
jgi:hypothetical protein